MAARDTRTGEGLSDVELRDQVITLYLAGHETTANLLSWTFYALASQPEITRKLEAELDLLPSILKLEDLKGLNYTLMVLSEVLRLYPPAWTIARNVIADDEVCGYRVPGGSFVLLSPFITQRLPEIWSDPLRFDPERFRWSSPKAVTRSPGSLSVPAHVCVSVNIFRCTKHK